MPRHTVLAALLGTVVSTATQAQSTPTPRIPTAARALPRGTVLASSDIAWVDTLASNSTLRVLASGTAVAPGWVTRRVVAQGEPLQAPAVVPPMLVRANDVVELVFRRDDVQLSLRGRVSRDAGAGETVTVRIDAQRRFEGIVEAPGRVRLM
jgi:flagella basal body P-ring formation protein FlgA